MPRPKLISPDAFAFANDYRIRVADVNYGGHLANNAVAGLLHQARIDVLHVLAATELDLGDGRTGLIQSDMIIQFCAEAFMREVLRIESAFVEIGRSRFRMFHRISRGADLVALAELGFAGFDYEAGKPGRLPSTFLERLAAANSGTSD